MSWIMIFAAVLFVAAWAAVAVTAIILSRRAAVRGEGADHQWDHNPLMRGAAEWSWVANPAVRDSMREGTMHQFSVRYRHSDDA